LAAAAAAAVTARRIPVSSRSGGACAAIDDATRSSTTHYIRTVCATVSAVYLRVIGQTSATTTTTTRPVDAAASYESPGPAILYPAACRTAEFCTPASTENNARRALTGQSSCR